MAPQMRALYCFVLRLFLMTRALGAGQFGTKFGAMPEEVIPLLREAHNDRGVDTVAGFSFHVWSYSNQLSLGFIDPKAIAPAASNACFNLNIGGGFRAYPIVNEIAETLKEAINDYFPQNKNLSVMAEPGREALRENCIHTGDQSHWKMKERR